MRESASRPDAAPIRRKTPPPTSSLCDVHNLGYYYDPSSFEDIQVSSGAQDITVPTGGVFINMVTKSGTNRFSSATLFTYRADSTQGDNIDDELRNFGRRPNAAAVDRITNFNFNAGGPLVRNRAFYFAALNDQRTHVNVVGFPAVGNFGGDDIIEKTDITSVFARPTVQLNTNHRLDGTVSRQLYDKPNRGASNTTRPNRHGTSAMCSPSIRACGTGC